MANLCEHLIELTAVDFPPARTPGVCEECLKKGTRWFELRKWQAIRQRNRQTWITETIPFSASTRKITPKAAEKKRFVFHWTAIHLVRQGLRSTQRQWRGWQR
jgi:hypothetical protein